MLKLKQIDQLLSVNWYPTKKFVIVLARTTLSLFLYLVANLVHKLAKFSFDKSAPITAEPYRA